MTLKFNQSFYYTRLAYPQNFIICGSQKLQIWFNQVCMHSQTHFKFQFNSSKISTTSVHVIFFLNTRLHYDPNKIGTTQFGSTKLEIQILQNNIQIWKFELAFEYTVTVTRGPHVSWACMAVKQKQGRWLGTVRDRRSSPTVASPTTTAAPTWPPRPLALIGALIALSTDL